MCKSKGGEGGTRCNNDTGIGQRSGRYPLFKANFVTTFRFFFFFLMFTEDRARVTPFQPN